MTETFLAIMSGKKLNGHLSDGMISGLISVITSLAQVIYEGYERSYFWTTQKDMKT